MDVATVLLMFLQSPAREQKNKFIYRRIRILFVFKNNLEIPALSSVYSTFSSLGAWLGWIGVENYGLFLPNTMPSHEKLEYE